MNLKIIYQGNGCAGGSCPTVYITETGSYVFQGYSVERNKIENIPDNESLIELPKDFLEGFLSSVKQQGE